MRTLIRWSILLAVLCWAAPVSAQTRTFSAVAQCGAASDKTISSNGDSFTCGVEGYASARIQTLDSYSGTWEVQCSVDGGTTFDTDDELYLVLVGSSTLLSEVTDTVGIYDVNVAGCTHVKVISTAGFAASDTTFSVRALATGGGASGGGGGGGGGAVTCEGSACATAAKQDEQTINLDDIENLLEASAANDPPHDDPDVGNPVKIGCRADTTMPSAVSADGDRTNVNCNDLGSLAMFATAHVAGGVTCASQISGGAVLETEVKGSAGQLYYLAVTSLDATPVYIRVYNDTSAGLDESSDTPILRYGIPAAPASDLTGREMPIPATGIAFSTGIIFRVTTGIADNNTGALSANEVLVNYCYK